MTGSESLFSAWRGFTIWRFTRFGDGSWALNATRWLYATNHAYKGDRRYFIRVGTWPGCRRSFGPVKP